MINRTKLKLTTDGRSEKLSQCVGRVPRFEATGVAWAALPT
ncbi:hypothetical protein [Nostoc spongiaeforme]|nr:hypothetical protein [Nostoc spongiaeforme]